MGIFMTGETLVDSLAVRLAVTVGAPGHQLFEIPLAGIEGVKDLVAVLTGELVPAAVAAKTVVLVEVASPAFGDGHGFGFGRVKIFPSGLFGRRVLIRYGDKGHRRYRAVRSPRLFLRHGGRNGQGEQKHDRECGEPYPKDPPGLLHPLLPFWAGAFAGGALGAGAFGAGAFCLSF